MALPVEITVEIGQKHVSVQDFLGLNPGSVIKLSRMYGEAMEVFVSGRKSAEGEVVIVGDSFGIRITRLVNVQHSSED